MSDLIELYQEMILDHSKNPRNRRGLPECTARANGNNPLCGDKIQVYVVLDGDTVVDVAFEGDGCAISTASASLMTESVKGRRVAEVEEMFERFHEVVTGKVKADPDVLGKLAVFSGVSEFPVRVKCATLAWHTLNAAVHHDENPVTTE